MLKVVPFVRNLPDGTTWDPTPFYKERCKAPQTLRRYWPVLAHKFHTGEVGILKGLEQMTMDSMRVTNGKVTTMAGPLFFMCYLGWQDTSLPAKLPDLFPCAKMIHRLHGGKVECYNTYAKPCGEFMFCCQCTAALQVLGNSWDLCSSTEVMVKVLKSAVQTWFGDVDRNTVFSYTGIAPHKCGPDCPRAPKK